MERRVHKIAANVLHIRKLFSDNFTQILLLQCPLFEISDLSWGNLSPKPSLLANLSSNFVNLKFKQILVNLYPILVHFEPVLTSSGRILARQALEFFDIIKAGDLTLKLELAFTHYFKNLQTASTKMEAQIAEIWGILLLQSALSGPQKVWHRFSVAKLVANSLAPFASKPLRFHVWCPHCLELSLGVFGWALALWVVSISFN